MVGPWTRAIYPVIFKLIQSDWNLCVRQYKQLLISKQPQIISLLNEKDKVNTHEF